MHTATASLLMFTLAACQDTLPETARADELRKFAEGPSIQISSSGRLGCTKGSALF